MREWLRRQAPAATGFGLMAALAVTVAVAVPVPSAPPPAAALLAASPIALPGPGADVDRDTYADGVDRTVGDLLVAVELRRLEVDGGGPAPYVLAGTQDDQWRFGAGAELEWRHVVDPDPLGRKAGSPRWQDVALRTGAWWMSRPGEGEAVAIAEASRLGPGDAPAGAAWPQTLWMNVRDDRDTVTLRLELWDAASRPHRLAGAWGLEVRAADGAVRSPGGAWQPAGTSMALGMEGDGGGSLEVAVRPETAFNRTLQAELASRWAPVLRFDSGEAFHPVPGDALEAFHGFSRPAPDLRTWDLGFNDGRDDYRLLLADFNGDRATDHEDARLVAELLVAGERAPPTVYAHVARGEGEAVVLQYWLLYFYNFVTDEAERDIRALVHDGDREFVQLTFPDLASARNGTPSAVAFSQHYRGLAVEGPALDAAPFDDGRLTVFVARGSHAAYPVAGDDRRLRPAFTGHFDRFDGLGRTLAPEDYRLELLGDQAWHAAYRWGPATRYGRDLGTSARPLLQHDFRYPFVDPLWWQASLDGAAPGELDGLYGGGA